MRTIVVDDEPWMIKRFEMESEDVEGIDLCGTFQDPHDALEFVQKPGSCVELAFLDIEMSSDMNGLELAEKLQQISPGIVIFFLSAYDQYMSEAFQKRYADYYILKPYKRADLVDAAERAKLLLVRQKKNIYIETFGRFNVYVDGKFVLFTSRIAKEILALLVHKRGTALDNKEAYFTIWEDAPYDHGKATTYRKSVRKLQDTLEAAGIEDILISSGKERRVDISKFDCDYYDFLNNEPEAIKKYNGEYMMDYSWGEETTAYLDSIKNKEQQYYAE